VKAVNFSRGWPLSFIAVLFVGVIGCDVEPLDGGSVIVTLTSADLLISEGHPGSYEVIARNQTDGRVEWGQGSSSCQLSLLAITPGGDQLPVGDRACTEDLVSQGLNPGQSRTEVIQWGGRAVLNGVSTQLAAGAYRLLGKAGEKGESGLLSIEVVVVP
jgi:hypothetical protein